MPTLVEFSAGLLEVFEGCRLTAYRDSAGIWTIGMGHTKGVSEGMQITEQQALALFAEDEARILRLVQDKPILQAGAMVSFGFNCGAGALERYLAGQLKLEDRIYDHRGIPQPGLIARRRLESMLIQLGSADAKIDA